MRRRSRALSRREQVLSRREVVGTLAGAAGFGLASGIVRAAYPERTIRLIVPFAAGGAVDAIGRLLGRALTGLAGVAVVIDNRGGAGGNIGMEAVARAPADGYTLLLSHTGFATMPGLYRDLPFDPVRDFAGVVTAASGAYVLAVNPAAPFASVPALVAHAKANPGRVTYASAGVGSTIHLAGELFMRRTGTDLVHIPYRGAAPALTDLVAGQVQMMFAPAVACLPLANSGKLRALAVSGAQRSAFAPDLPTVAESGVGEFDVTGWYGLAAPAATPPQAIQKLNRDINQALASADFVAQLAQQGLEPMGGPPEEASSRIAREVARWTAIIRAAGIAAP